MKSNGPDKSNAEPSIKRFAERFAELRRLLQNSNPFQVAERCGAVFTSGPSGSGRYDLHLWGRPVTITYPDYEVNLGEDASPASPFDTAFLLYYFTTADGAPLENRWVAFSDLPDGRFYNQAFQSYTGTELALSFGDDQAAFEHAAAGIGGRRQANSGARGVPGDAAFSFQALPCVPLAAVYWRGDEDFPSTCQLLFDASVSHYLPTDACAVLGSRLTRMLIKNRTDS